MQNNFHCPQCGQANIVKNDLCANNKQNYKCKDCNRQFVLNSTNKIISTEMKECVERELSARMSIRKMAFVFNVSRTWLTWYIDALTK